MKVKELKVIQNIGKTIRENSNWKDNKGYFSEITQEMTEQFFQLNPKRYLKFFKEDGLIDLFYGTVALEYVFNLQFGSVTPTVQILNELGRKNPEHFEKHGNWAGENRGDNPYTPFGYRYGIKTYQALLDHKSKIADIRESRESRTTF
jgi:hypothetical protein